MGWLPKKVFIPYNVLIRPIDKTRIIKILRTLTM
jgi:hypothetical protein